MPTCLCIFRPESKMVELTLNSKYQVINMNDNEIMIINNLNVIQWYPSHYFKFIWKTKNRNETLLNKAEIAV